MIGAIAPAGRSPYVRYFPSNFDGKHKGTLNVTSGANISHGGDM